MFTTRAQRKAETRARVLKAALEVFSERGFEAADTAEIARRAGVAHGTVFSVAPTKMQLAVAAHEGEIRDVVMQAMVTLPSTGGLLARIMHLYEAMLGYYAERMPWSRVIVQQIFFMPESAEKDERDQLMEEFFTLLRLMVTKAQIDGEVRPDVVVADVTGNLFSIFLLAMVALLNNYYPDREAHREQYQRWLSLVVTSIAAGRHGT